MSFRGINTTVIQIRRQVFTEVARMAYANVKGEQANHLMRKIPYTIIPGEEGKLRKDIFLERAIVEERVRLAMGLPTRRMDEHNSVVSGLEDASIADKYYDPPLVNVIKFACNRCPEKLVKVSDLCQGCLAHPCMEVCPKKAITWESGRSTIDQEKCIKCGRCVGVCPYNAIVKTERPCAAACGMGAIHSDELGRAEIDYSKCVSCGQCLVNCPFGAIADKGQIYQLIQGFNRGDRIYALVAPAFINQFPGLASTGKLKAALKAHGLLRCGGGRHRCRPVHRGRGPRLPGGGPREAELHGYFLLPGMEHDGKDRLPGSCQEHLHDHDPHGLHRPHDEAGRPRGPYVLHRTLRRQEAGSFPPHRPL